MSYSMRPLAISNSTRFALSSILAMSVHLGATDLAGRVSTLSGAPLEAARVALAMDGSVTSTDSTGHWRLQSSASVSDRRATHPVHGANWLEFGGPAAVVFQGADAMGRSLRERGVEPSRSASTGITARRASETIDTLLVAWNGEVRLRLTLSSNALGALDDIKVDTSTSAKTNGWNPSTTFGELLDSRDGQRYRTAKIGKSVWMAENLNFRLPSSKAYENSVDSVLKYGRLYSWASAMQLPDSCVDKKCPTLIGTPHRGVCPAAWHLPTNQEWNDLETMAGNDKASGVRLKALNAWGAGVTVSDSVGFRALPAGKIGPFGPEHSGGQTTWWTTQQVAMQGYALIRQIYSATAGLGDGYEPETNFVSVRCVADGN